MHVIHFFYHIELGETNCIVFYLGRIKNITKHALIINCMNNEEEKVMMNRKVLVKIMTG